MELEPVWVLIPKRPKPEARQIPQDLSVRRVAISSPEKKVRVSILGDINGDGKVNLYDVFNIALAFGSHTGEPRCKPNLDLNGDGSINLWDYLNAALNFGKTDP